MDDQFKAFHQLVDLCKERGYDPYGATFRKYIKYRGLPKFPQYEKGCLPWCFTWDARYLWEEHGPQSASDNKSHPAILFLSGREEWHHNGKLSRKEGPAVITSKGTPKFFLHDREIQKDK